MRPEKAGGTPLARRPVRSAGSVGRLQRPRRLAVAEVGPDATAFAYRGALATVQYTATWGDPKKAPAPFDADVRGFRATMRQWLGDAAYVNYADPSIEAYGPAYWAANYKRRQQINHTADPHGLFASPPSAKP